MQNAELSSTTLYFHSRKLQEYVYRLIGHNKILMRMNILYWQALQMLLYVISLMYFQQSHQVESTSSILISLLI